MNGIAARIAKQYPESNAGWSVRISGFYDWLVPQSTRDSLAIMMGAVGVLLLIACGNIASLMLARGATREREISIRVALGADRLRIVRQVLVEAVLLALVAGGLGLLGAWGGTRLLASAGPATGLPRLNEISLDGRVFLFALATAVPWAGTLTVPTESGSPSGSVSFAKTLIVTGEPAAVVAESFAATGGWFTWVTVTLTLPVALAP